MTTPQEPETVNLNNMITRGGEEAAVAFHLLNIDYHSSTLIMSNRREALEMLFDLLMQQLAATQAALMEHAGIEPSRLIVPRQELIKP